MLLKACTIYSERINNIYIVPLANYKAFADCYIKILLEKCLLISFSETSEYVCLNQLYKLR